MELKTMGVPLGSGRKHEFAGVTGLRESEAMILEILYKWNYQQAKANPMNIGLKLGISYTTVWFGLNYLKERGIARKSSQGSWFLPDYVKESISKALLSPNEAKENKGHASATEESA